MQCDRIEVPLVMGWLRPVILVPSATLCGLSVQQFEAILAHELAHILRHDYLANWLQRALEVAWFHHPAARWIGNCVREDRELYCDEWAVRVCGDRVATLQANERLVRKIDEQITDRVKAWMEARRAEVRRDWNHRDALKERVDRLAAERRAEIELAEDRRELSQARERRDQLRARLEERCEQSKGQGPFVEVIDVASPPRKPSTWF